MSLDERTLGYRAMSRILVTGGTGVLGSRVASRLGARGHEVRILSRRGAGRQTGGATVVAGELRSGRGLEQAVAGVQAIVHCASAVWRARATEVDGMRNLIAATGAQRPYLLYISIVGVDRIPYFYYRAKLKAEQLLERSGLPWTILRATQFHSLISRFAFGGFVAGPKGARAQLIDASEVADRLVELVDAGPSGRVPDIGGPEILSLRDVARLQREVLGRRLTVVELPLVGKTTRAFAAGHNLCPEQAVGRITYAGYLASLSY
jgi:uncharacterized protein YbjT (DUF2867 family)